MWNDEEKPAIVNHNDKLYKICEQFELVLHTEREQKKIDCKKLEFIPKYTHQIFKREKDEEVEGSGSEEIHIPSLKEENTPTERNKSPELWKNTTETLLEEQSNNAVEISGDKTLLKKESIQVEEAKTGENIQKASKDTNILLFLFLTVIGIGLAAFTYNYIKKRRKNRNAHDIEANENGETDVKPKINEEVKDAHELDKLVAEKVDIDEEDNKKTELKA